MLGIFKEKQENISELYQGKQQWTGKGDESREIAGARSDKEFGFHSEIEGQWKDVTPK